MKGNRDSRCKCFFMKIVFNKFFNLQLLKTTKPSECFGLYKGNVVMLQVSITEDRKKQGK